MYKIKQIPKDFIVEELIVLKKEADGNFAYFSLFKRGLTTEEAVGRVVKLLDVPRKSIGYAGSKDKDAVTKQYISVQDFNKELKPVNSDRLELVPVGKGKEKINLGKLLGNRFKITVRNLEPDYEFSEKILVLPNYFDEQRFSSKNYDIGRVLLKRNFKEAVSLVLMGSGEYEQRVKSHLDKNSTDYIGALRNIPGKILSFYVAAFQSYIFNESVSNYLRSKVDTYKEVNYSLGTFIFPEERIPKIIVPVVGFGTVSPNKKIASIIDKMLNEEGITLRDFIIREFPEISAEGDYRQLLMDVYDFSATDLADDELNPGKKKIKLKFELTKGSYATILIKALFG